MNNNNTKDEEFDLVEVTERAKKEYIPFRDFFMAWCCYELEDYCKKRGVHNIDDLNLTDDKFYEILEEYEDIFWKILMDDSEHVAYTDEEISFENNLFVRTKRDLRECVKYYSSLIEKGEEKPVKSISNRILEHFDKNPQKQNKEDISKALNLAVEKFKVQLHRLVKKGKVANPKRNTYCNINYKEK